MTLKQSQGHQTYNDNVDPSKVITMQSVKDLAVMVSEKKANVKVFFKQENLSIISLERVQKKKKTQKNL